MIRQTVALLCLLLCTTLGAGELPAPASDSPVLVTSNTEGSWDSQTFVFDGEDNIIGIGPNVYTYDSLSRIKRAGVISGGTTTTDSYSYDAFGNLYKREVNGSAGLSTLPVPVDWQTNQLEGAQYDGAGNLKYHDAAHRYEWDAMRMISSRNDGQDVYIYTAGDERIAVKSGETWKWSLRDLMNGKVLREMESTGTTGGGQWQWVEDFVHRDGMVVAAERPAAEGGRRHMHLDHLGSPRLLTDAAGRAISRHDFLPFGIELTSSHQERDRGDSRENKLRFTGHERDFVDVTRDSVDTLDYMHARYYRSELGRFLSVDPILDVKVALIDPQMWNRYTYVTNNPLKFTDPDGRYRTFYKEKPMTPENLDLDTAPPVIKWAFYIEGGLLTLAAGGPVRQLAFEASLLMMRNPSTVLAAMKVLHALGGDSGGHINPKGLTGGKLGYLLENPSKSGFFKGVMGFTERTLDAALRTHFADNLRKGGVLQADGRLAVTGTMMGADGKARTVKTIWQWVDGTWQFITAMPEKKIR